MWLAQGQKVHSASRALRGRLMREHATGSQTSGTGTGFLTRETDMPAPLLKRPNVNSFVVSFTVMWGLHKQLAFPSATIASIQSITVLETTNPPLVVTSQSPPLNSVSVTFPDGSVAPPNTVVNPTYTGGVDGKAYAVQMAYTRSDGDTDTDIMHVMVRSGKWQGD